MHLSVAPHRARVATMVAFATNGALAATLLVRYAEVKDALGLEAGVFGLAVAGFTFGAAGAFHLPGIIVRRFGSRWTTSAGTAWVAVALTLAAIGATAGNPWVFAGGLVLAGCADAAVDVAQNAQGLRVQEAYGQSVLSSMHAGWSIGATVGGVVGTAAASADVPLAAHLAGWGIVCTAVMTWSARSFLPDMPATQSTEHTTGRLGLRGARVLAPLALVALAGISVEEIGNNWSAVLLATERGVPASTAGVGLSILLAMQFIGRAFGDRFIDRVGSRAALMSSLATVVVGLSAAAWAPGVALTLVGFALAGLGSAITVPLAFARADALPGLRPHAGVTWIGWSMRSATIALSPAIGGITTLTSLPVAVTAVAGLAVLALAIQAADR